MFVRDKSKTINERDPDSKGKGVTMNAVAHPLTKSSFEPETGMRHT